MCIFQESFEQEAEEYECSVEKLYPLCDQCEEKVTNEISRRNHTIRPHLLNNASKVRRNKKVCLSRYHSWFVSAVVSSRGDGWGATVEAYVEGKEKRMQWCWGSVEMRACMEGKEKRMQLCWGSMEHVLTVIAFRSSLLLIGDWN